MRGFIYAPAIAIFVMMNFSDLNLTQSILNALDEMGLTHPTTIQQKAFSVIMSGRDVCGIAQTGTGKTLAYLLPALRQWTFSKDKHTQVLIIVPTRELAIQVTETIKKLTVYMSVEAVAAFGGVNMKPQVAAIENGADFVVATPGRLLDIIYHGSIKLKAIKKLVIDEVDEMLNLGFRSQLNAILDLLPAKRQNLMFSATITDEVEALIQDYFNAPQRIEAAPVGTPLQNIQQFVYEVPNFNTKINLLELLLSNDDEMNKVLVFVDTKKLADEVYERIGERFPGKIGVIHSNKEQNFRFNTVNKFQSGEFTAIIATDIIARGLDVAEVSHVVNFDMPDVPENYIHRIGRTGRADKKGIAISFVTQKEQEFKQAVEELMNYKIPVLDTPDDLEISDVLTEDEKPKVFMRETLIQLPKREDVGPAFHEKKAKNKKVNVKVRHADKMMAKYGKPKKRPPKKRKS